MFSKMWNVFRIFFARRESVYPKLIKVNFPKNVKRGKIEIIRCNGQTLVSAEEIKGSYRRSLDTGILQYKEVSPQQVLSERITRYKASGYFPIDGRKIPFYDIISIGVIDLKDYVIDVPHRVWIENEYQELKYRESANAT